MSNYLNDLQPFIPKILFWTVVVAILAGLYFHTKRKIKESNLIPTKEDYTREMIGLVGLVMEDLAALTQQCEAATEDVSKFNDAEWTIDLREILNEANEDCLKIHKYNPEQIPEECHALHDEVLDGIAIGEGLIDFFETHMDALNQVDTDEFFSQLESAGSALDQVLTTLIES
ncbi:MAG: hypothetical protein LBN22_09920 [Clostridiales Family XIII bacterium]|jgi:hypothetical protein|nr:hypothetical protein [Clostridiales Family XIII bacterium]